MTTQRLDDNATYHDALCIVHSIKRAIQYQRKKERNDSIYERQLSAVNEIEEGISSTKVGTRTKLAILLRVKVLVDGKEIQVSVWVREFEIQAKLGIALQCLRARKYLLHHAQDFDSTKRFEAVRRIGGLMSLLILSRSQTQNWIQGWPSFDEMLHVEGEAILALIVPSRSAGTGQTVAALALRENEGLTEEGLLQNIYLIGQQEESKAHARTFLVNFGDQEAREFQGQSGRQLKSLAHSRPPPSTITKRTLARYNGLVNPRIRIHQS